MDESFEIESIRSDHAKFNPNVLLPKYDDFRTIDWVNENLQLHKSKNTKASRRLQVSYFYEFFQTYIILTVVGIVIGTVAGCLNIITEYLSNIRTGYCQNALYLNKSFCCWGELSESRCENWVEYSSFGLLNYILFIIISVSFSLTASKLVLYYAPFAAGSGISEIKCIVSGFSMDKFLSFATFLFKSIGLPLAIASGLSVGKEGPSVHYAVCVGSVISKMFAMNLSNTSSGSSLSYKNILVASSAAGVAVAFGSPMGGVLFSIEEISNLFKLSTMWESYYCSLIAVAFLQLMNPFRTGQVVMFEVKFDKDWHLFEVPIFIILGLFGGVYGILISKFNIKAVSFRKTYLQKHAIKEVLLLTLITAMISYFNEYLRMDMTEGMQILFKGCDEHEEEYSHCKLNSAFGILRALGSLSFATIMRMILIVFTYGCKVPAGIFVPSMAAGATFGRALGIIFQLIREMNPNLAIFAHVCSPDDKNCISPGIYAFIGAAAGLSGITHLTVTVVVIMFELTGAFKYILPTMITVAVTKAINDRYGAGHGGIADQMIEFNGLPLIHPHEGDHMKGYLASDAMTKKVLALPSHGLKLSQLKRILELTDFQSFPIVLGEPTPYIQGFINRDMLVSKIENLNVDLFNDESVCSFSPELTDDDSGEISFKNEINLAPITVEVDTKLDNILTIFHKVGPSSILVLDEGSLKGLITRKDILKFQHYIKEQGRNHEEIAKEHIFENHAAAWKSIQLIDTKIRGLFQRR